MGDLVIFHFHAFSLREHRSTFRLFIEDTETHIQSFRLIVNLRSRCIQMIVINVISVSGKW